MCQECYLFLFSWWSFENVFRFAFEEFSRKLMDSACVYARCGVCQQSNCIYYKLQSRCWKGLTHFLICSVRSVFGYDRFVRQCSWPFRWFVRKLISIFFVSFIKSIFFFGDSMHSIRWSNTANWSSKIVHC